MNDLSLLKMQEVASKLFNLNEFPDEFIADFIYNSLSFETNNLNVEDVLKTIRGENTNLEEKRIISIINHKNAFLHIIKMAKDDVELDENSLKDIHEILMNEVNFGGLYRNVDISIRGSNHTPPAHLKVYDRMKKYFTLLNEYDDVFEKAAFSLLQLDKIHPFLDGNGKLARIILNYHLLIHGLAPVIFPYIEKDHYFECIEEYKINKDMTPFINCLKKLEKKSLNI